MEPINFYELLARKISGEANSQEILLLEQYLLEHPEDRQDAEAFAALYTRQQADKRMPVPPADKAWERHLERLQASEREEPVSPLPSMTPTATIGIRRKNWLMAASIAFIMLSGLSFLWFNNQADIVQNTNEWLSYASGDKRVKLTLQDGTVVWLNKHSSIVYNRDFGIRKRDLTLTGEAFFDVHHNPQVRMVVHARNIDITVKGTAFNVMAYPSEQTVETSLIRGSVQLSTKSDRQMTILLKPNEKIIMPVVEEMARNPVNPQEKKSDGLEDKEILYSINRLQTEQQSKLIPEIAWIEDRVVFQSEPFADVAKKLERFYGVSVEIIDPALAGKRFTGSFYQESLEESLNALQLTGHFTYRITNNSVTIMPSSPATQ